MPHILAMNVATKEELRRLFKAKKWLGALSAIQIGMSGDKLWGMFRRSYTLKCCVQASRAQGLEKQRGGGGEGLSPFGQSVRQ